MAAVRWTFCLEEPLVHFVTLFFANEYFTLLSRTTMLWTTFFVKGTEIAGEINEKIASISLLLIISSLYFANIFYISCQLSLVLLFMRGEYFIVINTMEAIFFSYPILCHAIVQKPFPVFTRYRTNSKPFGLKTRPDFFGSPIRTANRTRIRPVLWVPWVPCKRKAESIVQIGERFRIRPGPCKRTCSLTPV